MKRLFTLFAATTVALGGVAIAQTTTPDETKLKGADRAAAQKQLRDEHRAERAERERNPNAATPATPATPAVPADSGTGTAATPAVPATRAVPSPKSTDMPDTGTMGAKSKGGGKQ